MRIEEDVGGYDLLKNSLEEIQTYGGRLPEVLQAGKDREW